MEAVDTRRPPAEQLKQFLSTRRGAYTLALSAALLAALVLVVFVTQYRNSVSASVAPTPVLTADRLIPAGTAGSQVITEKLFEPATIAKEDLRPGAITDIAAIRGMVAVNEVLPGQQITRADFSAKADPIRSRLAKDERAIQIPIDKVHGLIGTVRPGDRVDILAAFNAMNSRTGSGTPTLQPLMRNVRIMAAPGYNATVTGSVILQLPADEAARVAFAADNGTLWFLLRPTVGATDAPARPVSEDSLRKAGS